jgi:hypothetical protein
MRALIGGVLLLAAVGAQATPANRSAMARYYGAFLGKKLDACSTCHQPLKEGASPIDLKQFPHNPFGRRLMRVVEELGERGLKTDIPTRIRRIASEDSDGDGWSNQDEILLGRNPGDPRDHPSAGDRSLLAERRAAFRSYLTGYRWDPLVPVSAPRIPAVSNAGWVRNPIDAFVAQQHAARRLKPRPEASKEVLLRRVSLDLTGLQPTPAERAAFLADPSPNAYEKVVDRLLASPRYGERWGRHWMDVWRYSDWAGWNDGGQIRDSKPHIWRWKDWIIESLNADKGYHQMVREMLAADEISPEDPSALRATGFLVRNFKLLSREQWMEDVVGHTSRAFLGITMQCAKCHNHMYDPITQEEYYRLRAVFEPHNVRTDRVPGKPDTNADGLVRTYDADPKAATYLFIRGDERHPQKDRVIPAGVPAALGGKFEPKPIKLPKFASMPDRRDFVIKETLEAARRAIETAPDPDTRRIAELKLAALELELAAEKIEEAQGRESQAWKSAAEKVTAAQRASALAEAELALKTAEQAVGKPTAKGQPDPAKRLADAKAALSAAQTQSAKPLTPDYRPRSTNVFPAESTGRRTAFAMWLTDGSNPLTARVAVNHIWARHFGAGLVPSLDDFGQNGRKPTHPQLLDWLADQLVKHNWSMKYIHRLMVTSSTYRQASTPESENLRRDPDNLFLWRYTSRRMEAELVRDNLLHSSGRLDLTMGGPEVDHNQSLTSTRRSVYMRIAAEKESEFLKIFDGPSVTECYERKQSVMPQQALALANSELALREARALARELADKQNVTPGAFVQAACLRVLARIPKPAELKLCVQFLADQEKRLAAAAAAKEADLNRPAASPALRARENLVLILFNHNDFVTVR